MRRAVIVPALLLATAAASTAAPALRFEDATASLPAPAAEGMATMDAVAADLDGDGDLDIVTPQEWRLNRVLVNDGRARFSLAPEALPVPPADELRLPPQHAGKPLKKDSEDVSVADFDGDGALDFIVVTEDDQRLGRANVHQYFRGLGRWRYARVNNQIPDSVANAVAHADITGDGKPDVLVAGDGQDRLLVNNGKGGFADETEKRLPRETAIAQDVEFFDADKDGDLDIVFGLEGGHPLARAHARDRAKAHSPTKPRAACRPLATWRPAKSPSPTWIATATSTSISRTFRGKAANRKTGF